MRVRVTHTPILCIIIIWTFWWPRRSQYDYTKLTLGGQHTKKKQLTNRRPKLAPINHKIAWSGLYMIHIYTKLISPEDGFLTFSNTLPLYQKKFYLIIIFFKKNKIWRHGVCLVFFLRLTHWFVDIEWLFFFIKKLYGWP